MAETLTRAEALRALIAEWEADRPTTGPVLEAVFGASWHDAFQAAGGSLEAVARLEAPLQERGWRKVVFDMGHEFRAHLAPIARAPREAVTGKASSEPRARLFALLHAHLHEAEATPKDPAP